MKSILLLVWSLTLIAASAGLAPIVAKEDYPRYAFNYAVSDPITHDNKAQWESRNGDAVEGSYSLREPDGSLRVVDYAANDRTGFNAIVKNLGPAVHAPASVTVAPVAPIVSIAPTAPVVAHVPVPTLPHIPLIQLLRPLNYGFGAQLAVDIPRASSIGHWSLPWDSLTGSYGGWVPLVPRRPYATVFSKKYSHGRVHRWVTGPIPLAGRTLVITKKH